MENLGASIELPTSHAEGFNIFAELEAWSAQLETWQRCALSKLVKRARGMAGALGNGDLVLPNSETHRISAVFRHSNMMRHHFIRKPLLNFTNFEGSLTSRVVKKRVKPDRRMLEMSPRYVNFDECLLLAKSGDVNLNQKSPFTWAQSLYETINLHSVVGVKWECFSDVQEASDE